MELDGFKSIKKRYFQIFFLNIISMLLSIIKDLLIIYYILDDLKLDKFLFVLSISIFISYNIEEGINLTLIPLIQSNELEKGKLGRLEMTNKGINISIIISIITILVYILLLGPIQNIVTKKFFIVNKELVIIFLVLSINLLFNLSRSSLVAYMQSDNRFFFGAKSKALNILIQIAFILLINTSLNIYYLLLINIIASFFQFYYMFYPVKKEGYIFSLNFNFNKTLIRKSFFVFLLIITIGLINTYINKMDTNYINSLNLIGLNNDIKTKVTLANDLFITGLITISYPIICLNYIYKNNKKLKEDIRYFLKFIFILSLISLIIIFIYNYTLIKRKPYKLLITKEDLLKLFTSILIIYLRSISNILFIFFNRVLLGVKDYKTIIISNILIFLLSILSFRILINFDNSFLSTIIYLLPFIAIDIFYINYIDKKVYFTQLN